MHHLPTQPGTIGNVLDHGFKLYINSFRYCFPVALMFALILGSPELLNLIAFMDPDSSLFSGSFLALIFVGLLVFYYLMMAMAAVLVRRLHTFAITTPESFGATLRGGFAKSLTVFGAFILWALAVLGGSLLLLVPGIIFFVSLGLYLYGVVIDDDGVVESLGRSHRLVWGNWWRTSAIYMIGFAVTMTLQVLVYGSVAAVIGISAVLGEGDAGLAALGAMMVVNVIYNFFVMPFLMSLGYAIFHDLKLRKEGVDLEARFDALPDS
ncbi:MAG: hypothetical protein KJO55_01370 [Gammaproteobacteria bacterium]|nr:hypothetical protein [Gammaproteobacteria bacterium]